RRVCCSASAPLASGAPRSCFRVGFFSSSSPALVVLPSFPTRRSSDLYALVAGLALPTVRSALMIVVVALARASRRRLPWGQSLRSEEHTSELQSRENLVCRLLLEKKKATAV